MRRRGAAWLILDNPYGGGSDWAYSTVLEHRHISGSIVLAMFNEPTKSDLEKQRKEERETRILEDKLLRRDVAQNPEFVAERLYRAYRWANKKSEAMEREMNDCKQRGNSEKADMYERWMLRYMTIEVQALSGLAAVSPEIRKLLSKE